MQQGSVILISRKFGPDVWQFRWSEIDRNGRRIYRKRVIGTVQQYPDAQAAREVTTAFVGHIEAGTSGYNVTVEQICEHFEQRELRTGDSFRSFATIHVGLSRQAYRVERQCLLRFGYCFFVPTHSGPLAAATRVGNPDLRPERIAL